MKLFLSFILFCVGFSAIAEIPAIIIPTTNGAPSRLNSATLYPATNSLFTYLGTPPMLLTNGNGDNISGYIASTNYPEAYTGGRPLVACFTITSSNFEVFCAPRYQNGSIQIFDGISRTAVSANTVNATGAHPFSTRVYVQYAERATRNIQISLSSDYPTSLPNTPGGMTFGGINVQAGDTITTTTLPPYRTLDVLGDSFDEGYSLYAGTTNANPKWLGGFGVVLGQLGLNTVTIADAQGGTGYINSGSNVGFTNYINRIFDITNNPPHFLLLTGGYNDLAYATNTSITNPLYVSATNLFLTLKNSPSLIAAGTEIAVASCFISGPTNGLPQQWWNVDQLLTNAAAAAGLKWVSPVSQAWFNTNNDGSGQLIGLDGVHPNVQGYFVLATNLNNFMAATFSDWSSLSTNPATAQFGVSQTNGSAPLGVNFTYDGTNGSTFAWSFGDGGASSLQNPVYTYAAAGAYSVSLVVNGKVTNTLVNLVTVTNAPIIQASAAFTASPSAGAAPQQVDFTYTGTNGSSFAWAFGDGGASTVQNPVYTYGTPGTFSVTLVVNGSVTNTMANLITISNTIVGQVLGSSVNVTNYGAVGDAVQFYVNTVSNSALVTTTYVLPSSSIGDAIEIFQAGTQTYGVNSYGTNGYGNQDLVAVINNVLNGTNIYISLPAQKTLINTFATFGHNNRANFQNALNAAATNTIINIPAGTYLILTDSNSPAYGYFGLVLNHGGITLDGAGPTATTILSQGAWTTRLLNGSPGPWRGMLFEENPPIANNNLPFVLENMTLDGGVQQGNTSIHGIYANPVDGLGWDTTHDAFLVWSDNNASAFNQMTWTNVVFQHWRGEMVKSIDDSTNGNLLVENCTFNDGNATAINIYPSIDFTNCLFNNLLQVAEYYQQYSTNTCYFQDNICTNITGNEFAINGGKGNNPCFIMQNNTFYLSGNGNNGIETVPADNVYITNNQFICQNYANAIVVGASGYQGTYDNSNIVISGNTIVNPSTFVEIGGGLSATDPKRVESVLVSGNVLKNPVNAVTLLQDYGWSTNITFSGNDCSQFNNLSSSVAVNPSSIVLGPYATINPNNLYYTWFQSGITTNVISYGSGCRWYTSNSSKGCAFVIANTNANEIPAGAQMLFDNQNTFNVPVYLNSVNGAKLIVTNGTAVTVNWSNNQWVYAGSSTLPIVSTISANVLNLGSNPAVIIANPGPVQLSATASAYNNDSLSWQWAYSVNGGSQTVYAVGSGANPVVNFMNTTNAGGNTNVWTLQVTDAQSGLSAQSQITIVVALPVPLGMQIGLHATTN